MRSLRSFVPVLALLAVAGAPAPVAAAPDLYRVRASAPAAEELSVVAEVQPAPNGVLRVDQGLGMFIVDARVAFLGAAASRPVAVQGDHVVAVECARGCRLSYRFRLADASRLRDKDRAFEHQGTYVSPASSWLLHAPDAGPERRVRLEVQTPAGLEFVTGLYPAADGAGGAYELSAADLPTSAYSAFGAFERRQVVVPGGILEVAVSPGAAAVSREEMVAWAERSARAVTDYYGRLPVSRALVILLCGGRRGVGYGTALGYGGASIMVWLGREASAEDLAHDWVLTHEMVHLGFPNLPRQHVWIEEGLATYLEPLVRARRGQLGEKEVWRGYLTGVPNGLPRPGDGGLDGVKTWGRMYWGGALFSLMADVEIRRATGNRHSLDDALRAILAEGGNIGVSWDLQRALAVGDRAVGVPVLARLYRQFGTAPNHVDVASLWSSLGVSQASGSVVLDDQAPLAWVRRAIAGEAKGGVADERAATGKTPAVLSFR